jgi:hypothetical protein
LRRVNIIWWIVSFAILIFLFWLAKRAEPDLRSSPDGMYFDCKYREIPFGAEQSAADNIRTMKWHRGRAEVIDDRVLVVAGPFGKVSPYREPLPIIARSPNPPRKTTVYVAGEGTTYVAVAVLRDSPADDRLGDLVR